MKQERTLCKDEKHRLTLNQLFTYIKDDFDEPLILNIKNDFNEPLILNVIQFIPKDRAAMIVKSKVSDKFKDIEFLDPDSFKTELIKESTRTEEKPLKRDSKKTDGLNQEFRQCNKDHFNKISFILSQSRKMLESITIKISHLRKITDNDIDW